MKSRTTPIFQKILFSDSLLSSKGLSNQKSAKNLQNVDLQSTDCLKQTLVPLAAI